MSATELPGPLDDELVVVRPRLEADIGPWVQAYASDPELGRLAAPECDPTPEELRAKFAQEPPERRARGE